MATKTTLHINVGGQDIALYPKTLLELIMCRLDDDTVITLAEYLLNLESDLDNPPQATADQSGVMSSEDKQKLDSVAFGATNYIEPTEWPAAMIVEDDNRHFISAAFLAQLSDLINNGVSADAFQQLVDDLNSVIFELTLQGILDGGSFGSVTVDTIDDANAVIINAGQYASGKVFI